jgi:hypothetical protein
MVQVAAYTVLEMVLDLFEVVCVGLHGLHDGCQHPAGPLEYCLRSQLLLSFGLQPVPWHHAVEDAVDFHFAEFDVEPCISERPVKVMDDDPIVVVNLLPIMLDEILSLH